jgi:hypothetical protein
VFVHADIPYHACDGIDPRVKSSRFESVIAVKDCREEAKVIFDESEFYRRLAKFPKPEIKVVDESTKRHLGNQLAWTVTYIAYACEQYRKRVYPNEKEPLDNLAIVCAPATYDKQVSVAWYVPLRCHPSSPGVSRAALKVLLLARAVGMSLEKLKGISTAYDRGGSNAYKLVFDSITHELSKVHDALTDTWLLPFPQLAEQTRNASQDHKLIKIAKSWKVIVAPELYEAAADRYTLWTGKNFLGRVGLGIQSSQTLQEAIRRLVQIIAGSHVAVSEYLEPLTSEHLSQSQWQCEIGPKFRESRDAAANRLLAVAHIPDTHAWSPNDLSLGTALIFTRMLSAAVSNVLEKPFAVRSFVVEVKEERLIVTIENECSAPAPSKENGTEAVLRFLASCVEGGELLEFGYAPMADVWRTSFSWPALFLRKIV